VQSCEEVARGLFVSCGDAPEVFDEVEETLNEISFGVEREIAVARDLAVCLGRDDGADFPDFEALDEAVGVVALVGQHGFGLDLRGERLGLRDVLDLAAGQAERQRIAQRIDDDMDFRRQTAARAAYRLVEAPFLSAPALC
jgi:hypothetical protein